MLDLRNGASPGNQEDLVPLRDRIFNKRVSHAEIEQIVLVNARWHDQERRFLDFRRLRRVLDELNQLVREDKPSGRYCRIRIHLKKGIVYPAGRPCSGVSN